MSASRPSRAGLPDLKLSNAILPDRQAREQVWARDGYWFFRGVIDLDAIAEFRRPVLDELKRIGVVDADRPEPIWNGRNRERFPRPVHAGYEPFPALIRNRRWREFLAHPKVALFFEQALGTQAQWVPVAELRIMPPWDGSSEVNGERFTYPHQDGFYNEGYRCLTAWMPLWPASRAEGGLAVAEGQHLRGYLHDTSHPPRFPIPADAIPMQAWRTVDFTPGDVVIFDRRLPHSGLHNCSADRFRVSFDVRCVLPGDPVPLVGHIVTATPHSIVIREESGLERSLRLTQSSYCRGLGRDAGKRLALSEVPAAYAPGQEVMVTAEGEEVRLLREPKY